MAERYQFGIDQDELAAKLAQVIGGIGDKTVAIQFHTDLTLSSVEDFEFKQLSIVYVQKRDKQKVVIEDEQHDQS